MTSPTEGKASDAAASLLHSGVRVSIELPEGPMGGACVAVVSSHNGDEVVLDLLDDLPEGDIPVGSNLGLFLPRHAGIYHWPCALVALRASGGAQGARLRLLSEALFVQRRLGQRWGSQLEAEVRRVRSARRSAAHPMKVLDLSRGGLKLEGPFQLSTGDTLEMTVDLGPEVQLVGRAVMAYPTASGQWAAHVSFVDGQREALAVVAGYITRRSQPEP